MLNFDYYFDLAENENLVLINFFQNNIDFSLVNLIKNGIIPIYPDFYHKVISLFSGNILFNARLFNIIISLLLTLSVILYSYFKNKNFYIIFCIPIILFDHHTNSNYLLINRVDTLSLFLGAISLILNFLYFDEKNNFKRICILTLFTSFSCFAFFTKQPSVIFILISLIFILFKNNYGRYKDILIFFLILGINFYIYLYFINNDIIEYLLTGYYLYNEKSLFHFFKNIILIFLNGYFILFLILFLSENKKLYRDTKIILIVLLTILISVGLFFNQGAIHNNFFLLNLIFLLLIIYKKIYFTNFIKFLFLILTLIYVGSPTFFNFQKNVYSKKINYSNFFPEKMSNKQMKILTNRHDYFLYKNKQEIYLDGSSYFQINVLQKIKDSKFISEKTKQETINLDKNLKKYINNMFFDYIIDENSNILKKYPQIKSNYKKIQNINNIEVYEKKK